MDETRQSPNYREVWNEQVLNFKFLECYDTKEFLWPFRKVWKHTYWNCTGAIVGAPPVKMSYYLSDKAYVIRILKGKNS